jgi:hypothetical protein
MAKDVSLVLVLSGVVALAAGACTSSSGGHPQDAGQQDVFHQFDLGTADSGGDGGTTDGGDEPCTKTGYTAISALADYSTDIAGTQEWFVYYGFNAMSSPYDLLSIQIYPSYGDPRPSLGPGTYTLGATAAEQDLATCGVCVYIRESCDEVMQTCQKWYFATGGTLAVTALDNADGFVATLTNARLAEVTVDADSHVAKVAGGGTWCISSDSIDTPLTTPFPCTSTPECTGVPDKEYCDTATSTCVQCLEEGHCTSLAATPHCDLDLHLCVECTTNAQCASNGHGHYCGAGMCGACASSFDCTNTSAPVCQSNQMTGRPECGVGGTCPGDDLGEPGDDGPAGARELTVGVDMSGAVCDASLEDDFYKLTTSATGNITFSLTWTATDADLDLYVWDAAGTLLGSSASMTGTSETVALTNQPAGTYYADVNSWFSGVTGAAVPYTIKVTTP